jgi:hypothetical protein
MVRPSTPGQLRAFVVLADELHFRRVAQRFGIASSTVSEVSWCVVRPGAFS